MILKKYNRESNRKTTYMSKNIQNQIINVVRDKAKDKIIEEIKKSKFFIILADERLQISAIKSRCL